MDGHKIIFVREAASQESEGSEKMDISATEEPPVELDPKVARQKLSVRFLETNKNEQYHRRGSIHEELCQMDNMKSRSTSQVKPIMLSLAERPPPVFSLTSITEPYNASTLFSEVNPQAAAKSEREIDEEIDRLLEQSKSDGNVVPDQSRQNDSFGTLHERRMTALEHQLLEFRHSETAKTSIKHNLQRLSTYMSAMSVLAAMLAIVDLEHNYMYGINARLLANASIPNVTSVTEVIATNVGIGLKACVSLVALLMCVLLYAYFHQHCRYLIVKHCVPIGATVLTSPDRWSFLVELLLCVFHLPPLTDQYVPNELQLACFLRLYLIARYMREHNHMAFSKSTRFLASVLQTELGAGFLVKTFFIKWPFIMIMIFYCLNLFGVGYVVFAIERAFNPTQHNPLLDTIWMQVVTMTTLGFGDVTPESFLARAFVGMSSVFGIFLMALLISVIHESLHMSQQEKRILAYVERQDIADQAKHRAASCIQATWRLYWFKHSGHDSSPRIRRLLDVVKFSKTKKRLISELYDMLNRWRQIRKSMKTQDDRWAKDFVADNTAIMLTDVARRVEQMDTILKRSLGIEDNEDAEQIEKLCQQKIRMDQLKQPVIEAPPLDRSSPPSYRHGNMQNRTADDSDGVSTETVLYHLADLGESLEESYHRTMTEFQALQSLIMTRKEGAAGVLRSDVIGEWE